jgi:hypothetical protein
MEAIMKTNLAASVFEETSSWPGIPPWWLLSSPQVAAVLDLTPATLHIWRTNGKGPKFVPPMCLKPRQGDPVYYQYSTLRSWAAQRVGLTLGFEEQIHDFFEQYAKGMKTHTSLQARMNFFDVIFSKNRQSVRKGERPLLVSKDSMLIMDVYFSRQPKWLMDRWSVLEAE